MPLKYGKITYFWFTLYIHRKLEALIEFGKIILPAGAVLYAMFLVVRMFIRKEYDQRLIDMKTKNNEIVLPIRLQAYERICLFLERITPKNLIIRLNQGDLTSVELQHVILHEVREEFGHNLSQQVYMSAEAWVMVKNAMEEIIMLINESAAELEENSKGIDLARKVFEKEVQRQQFSTESALGFVKAEIQTTF